MTACLPWATSSSLKPKRSEISSVSQARPCFAAAARSCVSPSRNWATLRGDACQPSPSVTTRRNAAGLAPPIQIGGCRVWPGLRGDARVAQAKCGGPPPADPDRRMRLLHGSRREAEVAEANSVALEARRVRRPQLLEHAQRLVAPATAGVEGCATDLE